MMGIQAVGVILINALLVTPAAAATLLTDRLPRMMLGSVIAVLSGLIGLYVSYYANVPSGAAIVLTSTFFFAVAWEVRTLLHRVGQDTPAEKTSRGDAES